LGPGFVSNPGHLRLYTLVFFAVGVDFGMVVELSKVDGTLHGLAPQQSLMKVRFVIP
jgi:hypothetical protein